MAGQELGFSFYREALDAEDWQQRLMHVLENTPVSQETAERVTAPAALPRIVVVGDSELSTLHSQLEIEPDEGRLHRLAVAIEGHLPRSANRPIENISLLPLLKFEPRSRSSASKYAIAVAATQMAAQERARALQAVQRFYLLPRMPAKPTSLRERAAVRGAVIADAKKGWGVTAVQYLAHVIETQPDVMPRTVTFSPVKLAVHYPESVN